MSIVVFGASGNIGSNIRKEALARGLGVTAVTHSTLLPAEPDLIPLLGDIANPDEVAKIVAGHEAVITPTVPACGNTRPKRPPNSSGRRNDSLFAGVKAAGVARLIIVGGRRQPRGEPGRRCGRQRLLSGRAQGPHAAQPRILRSLKRGEHDLDWTYVSPPLHIEPGERTARFRVGDDKLLRDANGESRISEADFAIAILDELKQGPLHPRRFTVAY